MKDIFKMWFLLRRIKKLSKRYTRVSSYSTMQPTPELSRELLDHLAEDDFNSQAIMGTNPISVPEAHIILELGGETLESKYEIKETIANCKSAGFLKKEENSQIGAIYITPEGAKFANSWGWYLPKYVIEDLGIVLSWYWSIALFVAGIVLGHYGIISRIYHLIFH